MCHDLYSPRIARDLIPILFRVAQKKKVAMTRVVDEILRNALHKKGEITNEEAQRNAGRKYMAR